MKTRLCYYKPSKKDSRNEWTMLDTITMLCWGALFLFSLSMIF